MREEQNCLSYNNLKLIMEELPLDERNHIVNVEKENFLSCINSLSRDLSLTSNNKFSFNMETDARPNSIEAKHNKEGVFNLCFKSELDQLNNLSNNNRSTVDTKGGRYFLLDESAERVCETLSTIFKNNSHHQSYSCLEAYEQKLVNSVIYKIMAKVQSKNAKSPKIVMKRLLSDIKEKMSKEDINWLIQNVINTFAILVRRKEEKLKFIMKNTLKHFRKQYFKNQGIKASKESELDFLEYYFKQHTENLEIDIQNFSDPLNNTMIKNPSHKTLSNDYFKLIFGVNQFKRLFFHYLDHKFKSNYQAGIKKKFTKMFDNLIRKLEMNLRCDREGIFNEYVKTFMKIKNNKFPWFDKQIDEAIEVFKTHINKLTNH